MRLCIIGHFGGKETFNDGQTVKTHAVYNAFCKYGIKADIADTYFIHKNIVRFVYSFIKSFFFDRKYIVLLSKNGRRVLFPFLFFMSRFMKKEIYHYAIGGRLADEVMDKRKWKKYILSFKGNWMESRQLVDRMNAMGIENAVYIPNFKQIPILKKEDLVIEESEPFQFCIFSRIMQEKGVEDAIRAITNLNKKYGYKKILLDLYGPVEKGYEDQFEQCISQSRDACRYCGVIPAEKSVETLKNYYALLFPTHWFREGIPGTVIDALSAGIPVVAREWAYCSEMLEHGRNGYIYEFDNPEKLEDMIEYAITHVKETNSMKAKCLQKAEQFTESYAMQLILEQMEI